jgi:hypothetical protein
MPWAEALQIYHQPDLASDLAKIRPWTYGGGIHAISVDLTLFKLILVLKLRVSSRYVSHLKRFRKLINPILPPPVWSFLWIRVVVQ